MNFVAVGFPPDAPVKPALGRCGVAVARRAGVQKARVARCADWLIVCMTALACGPGELPVPGLRVVAEALSARHAARSSIPDATARAIAERTLDLSGGTNRAPQ